MSLSRKQQAFAECVATLIAYGVERGYAFTFGDAYRDPRVFGKFGTKQPGSYSAASSVHKARLAVDLNLFVDGVYITSGDHPAYQELGGFWKALHPDARWGGDFKDANHFSFEYLGCM